MIREDLMEALVVQLTRIADVLERVAPEPAAEDEMSCRHPQDQRLALGTTGAWQCGVCDHREFPVMVD